MSTRLFTKSKRSRKQAGIALITTLMLMFLMSSLLVGFTVLLISNQQLTGSNNDDVAAFYGAEAGMEQLTAGLGNLFSQTYSPSIGQINALQTTPPVIPGISFLTGSGASGYTITPQSVDANGNPAPVIGTVASGPYMGMTAMITQYTLKVNARTNAGREVLLQRNEETVGIPMFQFAVFCDVDCSFHAGQDFTMGGRVHGNGNLFLASSGGVTLTLEGKVDAYKDIIRTYMDNGASVSANWNGTVSMTTNPGGSNYRNLALTEGSYSGSCNTNWPTISTGASPTDYGSNLIDGQGSQCKQYSTGAKLLNMAIVTLGSGSTQTIDLIRRPIAGEASSITGERYFSQASLQILLSDNPTDIMSLPCVEQATQPLDLSVLAQPVANWPATTEPYKTLLTKMTAYGTLPLPLAASGSNTNTYSATDGYWLPNQTPIIKGYMKIQAQGPYGNPCGTLKDVTTEILALGYVGGNLNPVSQSFNGTSLNPQWPGTAAQIDPLQGTKYTLNPYNATPPNELASIAAGYSYPLPIPTTSPLSAENATALGAGNFTGQAGSCLSPHPNAVIRLERIRDNPTSLYAAHFVSGANWYPYVNSGALATNAPRVAPVAVVCGVDPATKTLPIIADAGGKSAMWTPEPYDFWPNTLFDTREGVFRDTTPTNGTYLNLPTLNGTMHYVELDMGNLIKWLTGAIGSSGTLTYDSVVAPNDYSVYFSDRRGNYAGAQSWTGAWPPLSPSTHETGEYGWYDTINTTDPTNGCPNNALDSGEDFDGVNQLFTYGATKSNINYIMGLNQTTGATFNLYDTGTGGLYSYNNAPTAGQVPPVLTGTNKSGTQNPTPYGEYGFYTVNQLTTGASPAILANPNCGVPTYTNNIWPLMYASASNSARENPPIFFRRALKIINGKNLTGLGTCPASTSCGIAIASENPVYLRGDFNANSASGGFNDPSVGASIAADAVTILSNSWNDANSFAYGEYNIQLGNQPREPTITWYRTAIVAGKGVSFPEFANNADNGTDGGVHNFLRYIEDWGNGGLQVNYLGALVNLYTNRQATGMFKCCVTVYSVPNRVYSFDTNFLNPTTLPPRTPLFRDVDTTGWTRLQLAAQQ